MTDERKNLIAEDTPGPFPVGVDRRTFLKLAGFTFAGTVIAGCQRGPVEKAIPFLIKPEEITPGVATWYASTCAGCQAGCGMTAKNREGRPIKLEGNPDHPLSRGGLCAVGQAMLLELYDSQRLQHPLMAGKESSWEEVDAAIIEQLDRIQKENGAVRLLTGTITSPTIRETIRSFLAAFKNAKHVVYDPLSSSAILDAHEQTHGVRRLPHYRFDKAEAIVAIDADFLGTWISPVEFTHAYRMGRSLEGKPPRFSWHAQIESRVSLTGSNADRRFALDPDQMRQFIRVVAAKIAEKAGAGIRVSSTNGVAAVESAASEVANRLWQSKGRSLVVCGVNDVDAQLLINFINHLLGNYGATVDLVRPSFQLQGNDTELQNLLEELRSGKVAALFTYGVNPVYDLPGGDELAGALKTVPLVVSSSDREDETASVARFVCPIPHPYERWEDTEVVDGVVSVGQPLLAPFGNTRPFMESLALWRGRPQQALEMIRETWQRSVFPRQSSEKRFEVFWDTTVQKGVAEVRPSARARKNIFRTEALTRISQAAPTPASNAEGLSLVLYPTVAIRDGRGAHNPWLQELPDPVTKIVWDNYASVSPSLAARLNVKESDLVRIQDGSLVLELPIQIQPGQHDAVVAVALGYGRKGTDRFKNIGPQWFEGRPTVQPGRLVGENAAKFVKLESGRLGYDNRSVTITKTGGHHLLASTQEHNSIQVPPHLAPKNGEKRPIIQETTLAEFTSDPAAGSFKKHDLESMWPDAHQYPVHHWAMAIDLTACTGCSACVVGCQTENNIPVVGKDEVYRNREMSWIRIDRYYDESERGFRVSHQPMLCHHCDNAPCETVCPVLATVHNNEGLNQQIYNRCIGTRYCSNNCPYKVRRFNWFDYPHGDERSRLVSNPDIAVRERGVMEKCTFCVQRIQEAKIESKKQGVPIKDGAIQPACQQSCPANAIVFGDTNDPNSQISQHMKDARHYRVLEEIGIRPSVGYLTLVRNREIGRNADV